MVQMRNRYSRSLDVGVACTLAERRTKPEFAQDCDINVIMAKYKKTGILPTSALSAQARYGDFSQVPTYQEMHEKVMAAEEVFMALPAHIRKQFDNDPSLFLAAADTPDGRALMVKLGLGKELPSIDPVVSGPQEPEKAVVSDPVPSVSVKKLKGGTIESP